MTTTPPVWCATRLRYAPNQRGAIVLDSVRIEMVLGFSSWEGKVRSRKVDESGLNGWVSGFNGNLWLGRKDAVWLRRIPSAALGIQEILRILHSQNSRNF